MLQQIEAVWHLLRYIDHFCNGSLFAEGLSGSLSNLGAISSSDMTERENIGQNEDAFGSNDGFSSLDSSQERDSVGQDEVNPGWMNFTNGADEDESHSRLQLNNTSADNEWHEVGQDLFRMS